MTLALLLAFVRRWWPALVVLALLAGGWAYGRAQYRAGQQQCEADHAEAAREQQAADQTRVDQADAVSAQRQAGITSAERNHAVRIRTVYRDRPVACGVSVDGVRLLEEGDAARASAAAGRVPTDVPEAAPAEGSVDGGRDGSADGRASSRD